MFYENPSIYLKYVMRIKTEKAHTVVIVSWRHFTYEIKELFSQNRRLSSKQQRIVPRTSIVDCLKAHCYLYHML
jgi:hypothetical protein